MSQIEQNLRADQLTLYPMQRKLETEEHLRLRGGFSLWLIGMSVPIILLFEFRYVMVGGYVGPAASQTLGGIGLALMLLTSILMTAANRSAKSDNRKGALAATSWAWWTGLAALVVIGWQVCNKSMNPTDHFGMTFLAAVGTAAFYILFGWLAIWATRGRVKRLPVIGNYWGVSSTAAYTWYATIVWLIVYVLMYFL